MSALATAAWDQASRMAQYSAAFATPDQLEALATMSDAQLDALDFGAVKVDDAGVIQKYNKYESDLASVPQASAIGKNFFTQLAPCTNNDLFFGNFKKGVSQGGMHLLFVYTFSYKMAPTRVKVIMFRGRTGANWVLVKRA